MSIPLIMLTMVEQQVFLALNGGGGGGAGNSGGLSSILIRLDCAWLLLLMGIQVRADFMGESLSRPAMLLFTHVSTLDAVVILGTLPRALCAVVKVREASWGGCQHTYTCRVREVAAGGGSGFGRKAAEQELRGHLLGSEGRHIFPASFVGGIVFVNRRYEGCADDDATSSRRGTFTAPLSPTGHRTAVLFFDTAVHGFSPLSLFRSLSLSLSLSLRGLACGRRSCWPSPC